jgi:hypothetical protein
MMLLNPIIAILYNEKLDRYHAIIYEEKPMPGGGGIMRHKSKMHYTDGHTTLEECVAYVHDDFVPALKEKEVVSSVALCLEAPIIWDGEGIPAMVNFFEIEADVARRIL